MYQELIGQAPQSSTMNSATDDMCQESTSQASQLETIDSATNYMSQELIGQAPQSSTMNSATDDMCQESTSQASQLETIDSATDNMYQEPIGQAPQSSTMNSVASNAYQGTAKVLNFFSSSVTTGVTSVLLVGNPGVGKSAVLNALGGNFSSGYSEVSGMTKQISTQTVKLQGRQLRLIDMPGIYDATEGKNDVIDEHLRMLCDTLNDGSKYVVFFVITPRNGRVNPGDLVLMKLLLDNMKKGPLVGLILTQVKNRDYNAVRSGEYFLRMQAMLTKGKANLKFLEKHDALTLRDHDDRFSEQELLDIQDYVLSFRPKRVVMYDLVACVVRAYLDILKGIFS